MLREGFLFVPQDSAELLGVFFRPERFQRRVFAWSKRQPEKQ